MAIFRKRSANPATPDNPLFEAPDSLDVTSAIEAHLSWKLRLQAYIDGSAKDRLDADIVGADDVCELGMWIHSQGEAQFGDQAKFQELKETHRRFHACAGEIIREVDAGDVEAARYELQRGDYAQASARVKSLLAWLGLRMEEA